jgi:hypothetical protein
MSTNPCFLLPVVVNDLISPSNNLVMEGEISSSRALHTGKKKTFPQLTRLCPIQALRGY